VFDERHADSQGRNHLRCVAPTEHQIPLGEVANRVYGT
jgi:hypothetical protein